MEFRVCFLCNIANGYYEFSDYSSALDYAKKGQSMAKQHDIYNLYFSFSTIVIICCLYYLKRKTDPNLLKKEFLKFLQFTRYMHYKKLIDTDIERIKDVASI